MKKDVDGNRILQIENLYMQLNLLSDHKDKIKTQFGHIKDIVDLQLTNMVRLFVDSQKLDQEVKDLRSCNEVGDLLLKMESQHNILTFVENDWKTTWFQIKFVHKGIIPLAIQTS